MTPAARAHVVSSFTSVKGAMIEETYAVFARWDLDASKRANLDRLRRDNFIGATSDTWLRDVAKVLNRRFDPGGRDLPLVRLAQHGCAPEVWRPILLWHITRDEFLLRDFILHWLFPAYQAGAYRVRPEELHAYLRGVGERGGTTEHAWTETTLKRVAAGLLKMAADFGLLRGSVVKELMAFHLPEASFLYILHALRAEEPNPRRLIDSEEWRLFLMRPDDVEQELLRLHQFRLLEYHVAGTLIELSLPCPSPAAYAERMVA